MKKSIVQIQAIDPNQDYLDIEGNLKTIGTGFFIDKKGLILTCAHVIDNQSKDILKNGIYVKLEGETFKAKRVDDEYIPELNIKNNNKFQYDISVLSIEIDKETQKNISPFPILKPPKKGRHVYRSLGFVKHWFDEENPAPVSGHSSLAQDTEFDGYTYSSFDGLTLEDIQHGYSGAPVISEEDGRVIGLISAKFRKNRAFITPISPLLKCKKFKKWNLLNSISIFLLISSIIIFSSLLMYIFRGDFLNFSFFLLASFCIGLISLVLVRSGIINLFDQSKYIQKEYSLNKKYINIKIYISIILFSFIFFETFQIINCLIKKDTFYENLIVAKENNKFGSLENAKSIANAFNLFPNREEVFRFYYFAIGNDIDADRKSKFANKFIENLNDQKYRSCDGFLFCCSCNKKIEYSILDVNAFTEKGDWTNAINLLDQKIAITNNKHFKIQKNILIINDVSNTDESKYNKAVEELKKLPYEIISNYPQAEDYLWQINAIPECNNTKSLEKSDLYFNNFFKRYSADISYATNYHIPPRKLILFHMIGEITKAKVLQGNGALKTFIVETISKCNEMIELLHKRNTEDKDFLKNIFTKLRDKHTFKNTNKDLYLDHMQTRNWINYKY